MPHLTPEQWLCRTHVYHATEAIAEQEVVDMTKRKDLNSGVLSAFKCPSCDGWHIGRLIKERTA